MELIKQNSETLQIEFSLEEFFRIKSWLNGKPAGDIDIQTRDALENFIQISAWINPDINIEYDSRFSNNIQEKPITKICNSSTRCSNFTQNLSGICDECTKERRSKFEFDNVRDLKLNLYKNISGIGNKTESDRLGLVDEIITTFSYVNENCQRELDVNEYVDISNLI
ncbi:hypothetical protein [Chryseobacterium oncorhynchi]|uniref:Uncharacterized protein n=1 Tax=Chryseobacterium oncorhynchi TaxID=741074 RepID=A0A316WF51_9FLAO|nr:hypothetical protein [Chryseobacterium oncorhynchi]PWN60007.1 hypothetical protein C1638_020795 [Chryseobacterium oncorhynchi]